MLRTYTTPALAHCLTPVHHSVLHRRWYIRRSLKPESKKKSPPEVRFGVHVRNDNREGTPPLVRLKAVRGPGDGGEPVITVMLPDEE